MTKRLIQFLLLFVLLSPVFADAPGHKEGRKQMKAIKEQLKAGKASDVVKAVEKLRQDSVYAWNPVLLQYSVEAHRILNDKENEKFYLNAKADTIALFNTTYNLINTILLADSAEYLAHIDHQDIDSLDWESMESGRTKVRYRNRKTNRSIITNVYRNIVAAPRYFSAHGKWDETVKFTSMAIELGQSDIMDSYPKHFVDQRLLTDLAVMNINACYRLHRYDAIEDYAYLALRDTASIEDIYEKLAYAELQRGDTTAYHHRLIEGHSSFPDNMFFFSRLVDSSLHKGDSESVLRVANQTLEYVLTLAQNEANICIIDTTGSYDKPSDGMSLGAVRSYVDLPAEQIAQIFEARAIAHHNVGNQRQCVEDAENILSWNPDHPRADFYIGASYYALAKNIPLPASVGTPPYQKATYERNRLFSLARPHLEHYRKLAPSDVASWAPILYDIYLYLNMGAEFEEISRYVQ